MYQNSLVTTIQVNGKNLREVSGDTVYLPYGAEYSILLKNLNTKRAKISLFIDGESAIDGGLLLNAGEECNLQRYVKNGNLTKGNRFKFINRTSEIEEHRGIKAEDGLLRVQFEFEKYENNGYFSTWYNNQSLTGTGPAWSTTEMWKSNTTTTTTTTTTSPTDTYFRGVTRSVGDAVYGSSSNSMTMSASEPIRSAMCSASLNNVGITVPGSVSDQKFVSVSGFQPSGQVHTMVLRLLGQTGDDKPVEKPLDVKSKVQCVTCNLKNRSTSNFCSRCGTALVIFA